MLCFWFLLFFFFKQKTAYEMRISDWSSDVCSSDLLAVREDAHTLYGFLSSKERSAFRALIKVTGIGARTALAVLSGMSVDELANAITQHETGLLTRVPGIGKKTAERLLLEIGRASGRERGGQYV